MAESLWLVTGPRAAPTPRQHPAGPPSDSRLQHRLQWRVRAQRRVPGERHQHGVHLQPRLERRRLHHA